MAFISNGLLGMHTRALANDLEWVLHAEHVAMMAIGQHCPLAGDVCTDYLDLSELFVLLQTFMTRFANHHESFCKPVARVLDCSITSEVLCCFESYSPHAS